DLIREQTGFDQILGRAYSRISERQPLFFGYFLLGQQKKVTPPGGQYKKLGGRTEGSTSSFPHFPFSIFSQPPLRTATTAPLSFRLSFLSSARWGRLQGKSKIVAIPI
ncbi:MAG: hypothetical protein KJ857_05985, partial [Proteobacteria bacterium]|nr:hypothetical protein [Pseudomonadota bacterium]